MFMGSEISAIISPENFFWKS